MKLLLRVAIALAALLVLGWFIVPPILSRGVPRKVSARGIAAASIYKNPDRVDIYRLHHDKGPGGNDMPVNVVTDSILEQHVSPSADWIRRFRTWAAADPVGPLPGCGADPGFAIRFTRGTESMDYLVCLHCSEYAVKYPGDRVIGGWSAFGPSGRELVPLLSEAYPQDVDLHDLASDYLKH